MAALVLLEHMRTLTHRLCTYRNIITASRCVHVCLLAVYFMETCVDINVCVLCVSRLCVRRIRTWRYDVCDHSSSAACM